MCLRVILHYDLLVLFSERTLSIFLTFSDFKVSNYRAKGLDLHPVNYATGAKEPDFHPSDTKVSQIIDRILKLPYDIYKNNS